MNYRDYKRFASGCLSHVFNRGNGKMNIFRDDQDYIQFLKRVCLVLDIPLPKVIFGNKPIRNRIQIKPMPRDCLDILTFVLMPNHIHFIFKQNGEISPSKFMHKLCTSYSRYFSKKYKHVGNLFQDQFKAVLITSDAQLIWLVNYIHNNPLKAGLTQNLNYYKWSSYQEYKNNTLGICNKNFFIEKYGSTENFIKNTQLSNEASNYLELTIE